MNDLRSLKALLDAHRRIRSSSSRFRRSLSRPSTVIAALLLAACASCADDSSSQTAPRLAEVLPSEKPTGQELSLTEKLPDTSFVLIVSDTMRKDRMGAYGGSARTPAFDTFAGDHVLFNVACTQAPWTKPSIATLFTSLYPSQHGCVHHPSGRGDPRGETVFASTAQNDVLSSEFDTLAEVLNNAGFRTAGFVGNPWMKKEFGYGQGFDVYDDSFSGWDTPGEEITRAGLEWLKNVKPGERFFLYLHYMDCHRPYVALNREDVLSHEETFRSDARPIDRAVEEEIIRIVSLENGQPAVTAGVPPCISLVEMAYDRGLESFDSALGSFLESFSAHEAFEQTAIVVTSDHGEALFERGYGRHGTGLYSDEVAVPMAARLPGVTAGQQTVTIPVGLIDIMPTACAYLGVPTAEMAHGRNLLESNFEGSSGVHCLVTEGVIEKPQNRAIQYGSYKLLWQPELGADGKAFALFNLKDDPLEQRDLLDPESQFENGQQIVSAMLQEGRNIVSEFDTPEQKSVPMHPDSIRRLKSLGYLE